MATISARVNKILRKIYYDSSHPAGYSSRKKLYEAASGVLPSITQEEVTEWLLGEPTYTLHFEKRRKWKRNRVHVTAIDEYWQSDITFLKQFKKLNQGYIGLLTVIDCLSKFAWGIPIKSKKPSEIVRGFNLVFKSGRKPYYLQTDKGKEFVNREFKNFLNENDVSFFTSNSPEIKCSIVERFNKTLKSKIFKLMTTSGKNVWIDRVGSIIDTYNKTKHSATKFKPIDVTWENQQYVYENLYKDYDYDPASKTRIKEGDTVRVRYEPKVFDRGYHPSWTDKVYTVESNIRKPKAVHKLSDGSKRRFYDYEVQRINPILYRVEKILKVRIQEGKKELLVKWLNYPESENSWVKEVDLLIPSSWIQ